MNMIETLESGAKTLLTSVNSTAKAARLFSEAFNKRESANVLPEFFAREEYKRLGTDRDYRKKADQRLRDIKTSLGENPSAELLAAIGRANNIKLSSLDDLAVFAAQWASEADKCEARYRVAGLIASYKTQWAYLSPKIALLNEGETLQTAYNRLRKAEKESNEGAPTPDAAPVENGEKAAIAAAMAKLDQAAIAAFKRIQAGALAAKDAKTGQARATYLAAIVAECVQFLED